MIIANTSIQFLVDILRADFSALLKKFKDIIVLTNDTSDI